MVDIFNIIKLPSMRASEDKYQQLERQFGKEQFTDLICELLQSLNIATTQPADKIYEEIRHVKGKVVGNDVLEIVQLAQKDQEGSKIQQEVNVFRGKINELVKKGITCISIVEFQSLFGNEGIIVSHLQPHMQKLDYISLDKLTKVLDNIQKACQTSGRLSKSFKISNLAKSNIFQQTEFNPEIKVDDIIQYVEQNILDPGIKINLTGMLKNVGRMIYEMEQSQLIQKQVEASLRANQEQNQNELFNTYKVVDTQQAEIDRLSNKIKTYEEEVAILNKRYQDDVINNLAILEDENERLSKTIFELTVKSEEMQTKVSWFKENYEGLTKQYEQFLQEKERAETKDRKQKEERMFIQRTVKQQLEDAQGKISRLRAQNGELKNKNTDLLLVYENKIHVLEERIKQLQSSQPTKIDFIANGGSKIRNSYLLRRSGVSNSNGSIRGSRISDLSENKDENENVLYRSSVEIFENIIKENNSINPFKKKSHISIDAASILVQSDEQEQELKPEEGQQKREKSRSIIQPTIKKQPQKISKNKSFQVVQKPVPIPEVPKNGKKVFNTHGYFLTAQGNRYPSFMILSEDRISFLDTKMRPNYSIKFNQVRKIIFCYHNITWLVLKVKNHQRNQKNQTLTDIVFTVQNRHQVLQFLHKRCSSKLSECGTKLNFQKQDSIWITNSESETLLSNYTNYYNLSRISTNNTANIFLANIKWNSIFNVGQDVILIVTEIGILIFEEDGQFMLERSQKLLYLLPIVELMEIRTNSEQKLELRYTMDKKVEYKIKVKTVAETKRLRSVIEDYRKASMDRKQAEISKYSVLASVLNKSNP